MPQPSIPENRKQINSWKDVRHSPGYGCALLCLCLLLTMTELGFKTKWKSETCHWCGHSYGDIRQLGQAKGLLCQLMLMTANHNGTCWKPRQTIQCNSGWPHSMLVLCICQLHETTVQHPYLHSHLSRWCSVPAHHSDMGSFCCKFIQTLKQSVTVVRPAQNHNVLGNVFLVRSLDIVYPVWHWSQGLR